MNKITMVVTSDIDYYATWTVEELTAAIEKQETMAAKFQRAADRNNKGRVGYQMCADNCTGKADNYKLALMVKAGN